MIAWLSGRGGAGFTIFETVVVLGIVALFVGLTVPRFLNSFVTGGDQTRDDAYDVKHLFDTGRQYAVANRANDHWGIHIVDNGTTDCASTTTVDCVVLYKGTNFAARDTGYDTIVTLRANNSLSSIDNTDYYFNRFSGYLMNTYALPPNPEAHYTATSWSTRFYPDFGDYYIDKLFDISGNNNYASGTDMFTPANPALPENTTMSRGTYGIYVQGGEGLDIPNTILGSQNSTGLTYALAWQPASPDLDHALIGGAPNNSYNYFASGGLWIDNDMPKMTCYDINGGAPDYYTAAYNVALDTSILHHIAGTYDPTDDSLKLYVDGDLAAETTCASIAEDMSESYIGINAKSTDRMVAVGTFDDVLIYDRPLTATEIRQLSIFARSTTTEDLIISSLAITNGIATTTIELNSAGFAEVITNTQ